MHQPSHHAPGLCAIAALMLVALTSCGNSDPAIGHDAVPAAAGAPAPQIQTQTGDIAMSANDCGSTNLSHSICAIRAMLDDVEKSGDGAGGGVTGIAATSSTAFSITLGMEGRSVTRHYEFDFTASPPRIVSKTETVKTHGH